MPVGGGPIEWLGDGAGLFPYGLQVDDRYLYWGSYDAASLEGIGRMPKSGGNAEWFGHGSRMPYLFLPDGDQVIFADGLGNIFVTPNVTPALLQLFASDPGSDAAMTLSGRTLYVVGVHAGRDGLFAIPLSNPRYIPIATWPSLPPRGLSHVAIDGSFAYVIEGVSGALSRIDVSTGATVTLFFPSTPQEARGDSGVVVVDTANVWMIAGRQLWRVAKDGSGTVAVHSASGATLVLAGDSVFFSDWDARQNLNTLRVCR